MNEPNLDPVENLKLIRRQSVRLEQLSLGTLHSRFLTCGRSECRCRREANAKHGPYTYLVYSDPDTRKTISLCLGPRDVKRYQKRIARYAQLLADLRRLLRLECEARRRLKGRFHMT